MTPDDQALMRLAYGRRRSSRQRLDIATAAAAMCGAFTVEDLARAAGDEASAPGTATAYRAVSDMLATGFLEEVGEREGRALYVHCDADGHHHHVVCTGCGAVATTPCTLAEIAHAAAADSGFTVVSHRMVAYGLCPRCAGPGMTGS